MSPAIIIQFFNLRFRDADRIVLSGHTGDGNLSDCSMIAGLNPFFSKLDYWKDQPATPKPTHGSPPPFSRQRFSWFGERVRLGRSSTRLASNTLPR